MFYLVYTNRRPKSNNCNIPAGPNAGVTSSSSGVAFSKSSSPAIETFTLLTLSYLKPNSNCFYSFTSNPSIFKYLVPTLTSLGV